MILEHLHDLKPKPLMTTLAPKKDESRSYEMVACKFGNVPKGSVLLYQQKLSENSPGTSHLSQEKAVQLEHAILLQSDSQLWYSLPAKRITASKFGDVSKCLSGFENPVKQLYPTKRVVTADM
ncbi:hypothetical protein pdam_00023134 [Pocillopora damicornis]|uniref:Uncharacterized protein n=1 Tax=Pocillopora damicornis TaxID=46731 RepID=A0A3M6T5W7_POCDA|nr:hypothetical protein pdam_00023134 [Pocillopora damicornis]